MAGPGRAGRSRTAYVSGITMGAATYRLADEQGISLTKAVEMVAKREEVSERRVWQATKVWRQWGIEDLGFMAEGAKISKAPHWPYPKRPLNGDEAWLVEGLTKASEPAGLATPSETDPE